MENYAGFLEYADHHVGRLIDALAELGVLDDTLVYYIIGDNGASAEGTLTGTFNAMIGVNGGDDLQTVEFMREHMDEIGSPGVLPALRRRLGARAVHAVPVDQAGRVALGRHAQRHDRALAERDRGAGRAAPPVHARDRRRADGPGGRRAARARRRSTASRRSRMEGTSMAYAFDDADAAERHETQYFEMFCNRGIYHKGWSAVTKHRTPWKFGHLELSFDDDVWELYDGSNDWTQAHDLAAEQPEQACTSCSGCS